MSDKPTIVTGLFNLGRGELGNDFSRSYDHYVTKFKELLWASDNFYIYTDVYTKNLLSEHEGKENIHFHIIEKDQLKEWFGFYDKTNEIRQKEEWKSQASWLSDSPQCKLDMYNPLVMSKFFMVNDATHHNPFNSEYFYWIDAGITNTVHPGYFYHDKVFNNIINYTKSINNKFLFLSYPYVGSPEIHGFPLNKMQNYSQTQDVNYVCRGGFFGGRKNEINELNNLYWGLLNDTLNEGLMGTEESIFTIMSHLSKHNIHRFEIEDNGLIAPFFETLKSFNKPSQIPVHIYILTYNSPKQLKVLLSTFEKYDKALLSCNLVLINNSIDKTTFEEYDKICEEYNIHEIHYANIGICGGRQEVAKHFEDTNSKFYLFFEDDMNFYINDYTFKDKLGFSRYVPNILSKIIEIMIKEKYDFLKLSFTEFYGDNSVQWAWYNVPQHIRDEYFPDHKELPKIGRSSNPPLTSFNNIKFLGDLGYIDGDIYYDNWPAIFSKEGNRKVFLETLWEHPYEQTWMSYVFQKQKENYIKSAVLLLSPIEHDRFDYYPAEERIES